jgi:phosphoglycolate phosphatase
VGDLHGRLIAFDLDGTVIDSRRDLTNSANELVQELGGSPLSETAVASMVGEGAALLVRRVLASAGLPDRPGALARFLDIYDTRLLQHTVPYEGVVEALEAARTRARVTLLTNKPFRATTRILDGLGLTPLFDEVIGGDGPHPRKPDPTSLLAMMVRADAGHAGTLLVGDSAVDHETAVRAGVRCCLVKYGFGWRSLTDAQLAGAAWVVETAPELPAVFDRLST